MHGGQVNKIRDAARLMRLFIAIYIITLSSKVVDRIVYCSSAIENKNTLDICGTSRETIEK
jgi:hypothetical protein